MKKIFLHIHKFSNDFSHLEDGFITKRRHQNAESANQSRSKLKFKCLLCPKYYIQFCQELLLISLINIITMI